MRLPSGRLLAMCRPEIVAGDFKNEQLVFWGVNSETKRWQRKRTYGGDLFQSAVQATARDILAAAMLRVEAAGYLPVMSVHDEVVAEARAGSLAEFESLMVGPAPGWAGGLPIAVEGWSGTRYRK
jgi:DNA polymerase